MANIDTTTKPMAQKESTELKAIFQASPTDPYANLLWESNRTPFSNVYYVDNRAIEKRSLFDPETKEWTTTTKSTHISPNRFTRDFEYGGVGYYSYSEGTINSLDWHTGGYTTMASTFYPSTAMPASLWEICKTSFNPAAVWGRKDCSTGYYSDGNSQYVYVKTNNRFDTKVHRTTSGAIFKPNPAYLWALGDRLFYSNGSTHYEYKYDVTNEVWVWDPVTFSGMSSFSANNVWSDGDNTYYRYTSTRMRQLDPATLTWSALFNINISISYDNAIFTDGHSCYTEFKYDSVNQEYTYYEWDKYHKTWIQKTGSNMDFPQSYYNMYIFNGNSNELVADYGNWGEDQEPYKDSMWATNGSVQGVGTTFYARFWPNANNSYKEINNE